MLPARLSGAKATVRGLWSAGLSTQAGAVTAIDDETTFAAITNDTKSVVYFTAGWCAPCRAVGPVYAELSEKHKEDLKFASVDIDAHDTLALEAGVRAVPTFQMYSDGKLVNEIMGADVRALKEAIERSIE